MYLHSSVVLHKCIFLALPNDHFYQINLPTYASLCSPFQQNMWQLKLSSCCFYIPSVWSLCFQLETAEYFLLVQSPCFVDLFHLNVVSVWCPRCSPELIVLEYRKLYTACRAHILIIIIHSTLSTHVWIWMRAKCIVCTYVLWASEIRTKVLETTEMADKKYLTNEIWRLISKTANYVFLMYTRDRLSFNAASLLNSFRTLLHMTNDVERVFRFECHFPDYRFEMKAQAPQGQ